MRILRCRFPFPPQDPPVVMPEACSARCPKYDAGSILLHASMPPDDPELLATLRSFADWLYVGGQDLDEQIRYAAQLYTRDDHDGTCLPKTLLFAHYKHLQFSSEVEPLQLSDAARAAMKGEPVRSWPDGELASGTTWNEMFGIYSEGYD